MSNINLKWKITRRSRSLPSSPSRATSATKRSRPKSRKWQPRSSIFVSHPPALTPRDCDLGQAQPGHAAPPEHLGHARRGILRLLIGIRQAHSAALGTGKRAALILRRLTTCVLPSWEKRARQLVWPHRCWGSASSISRINMCTAPLSSKCCRLPTRSWPTTRTAPFWPLSRT